MRPLTAGDDMAYCSATDTKTSGDVAVDHPVLLQLSDFTYLVGGQDGLRFHTTASLSPFTDHVIDVVSQRSQEEMIGTHTRRVIASVKNTETSGDRTMIDLPDQTMRQSRTTATAINPTVAIGVNRSEPQPTGCIVVDASNEAPPIVRIPTMPSRSLCIRAKNRAINGVSSIDLIPCSKEREATSLTSSRDGTLTRHHDLPYPGRGVDLRTGSTVAEVFRV